MKKHKGSIEAYFTVEASLVMPVVIGSVIFVICFLLYWYNRCLMEQDLSVMAVKASQSEAKTPEELGKDLRGWREKDMKEKHYAWEMSEVSMSKEKNWITLRRNGKLLMGDRVWRADASSKASQINPASLLRVIRRMRVSTEEKG